MVDILRHIPRPFHESRTGKPVLSSEALLLLGMLAGILLIWFESLRIREFIIRLCRKICNELDLQLLDQTVSLCSVKLRRSNTGGLCLHRIYQFEVSRNGADRYPGFVSLLGKTIQSIQIDGIDGMTTYYQNRPERLH